MAWPVATDAETRSDPQMPTYEYRCLSGHKFDLFQSMSDEPDAECPQCGERGERLLSGGAGFIFKGEGFYATDYRSEEYKKAMSSDTERAASSEESTASKDGAASSGDSSSPSDSKDSAD